MTKNLAELQQIVEQGKAPAGSRFDYPPPIAKKLGFKLIAVELGQATIELYADPALHANPMVTIHGGVVCDIADVSIGTAHATTLDANESFTTLDLQNSFFRPIWKEKLLAIAKPINLEKTVSRYHCDLLRSDGKLVAQATSTVMTLRGTDAKGR
ncbi:PaaI family thioesterase [Legionella hackeliae]|uniref:Thioesterase domain-containing protein n=1 Tax=Legionella hackeliae TaxID=449 RepID=A0A0A8ULD5_LEGHA|nr:PaaI family thioesterase [Legionella hackeliae]KTD14836.1 hypothetical protein Lhac_0366 [Legionella hackeliae]CEK09538.1 conserved protein of unknown function [Legionella hackeliae]